MTTRKTTRKKPGMKVTLRGKAKNLKRPVREIPPKPSTGPVEPTTAPVQDSLADFGATAARRINISQLHQKTGIDRATIRKWLEIEGVPIYRPSEKEALVDEARAMEVLAEFQSPAGARKLREFSKAKREDIEARRAEIKLNRESGTVFSRADVFNAANSYTKALWFRFVKCYPRDNARRLAEIFVASIVSSGLIPKSKEGEVTRRLLTCATELQRNLETDLDLILKELKEDNLEFLVEGV